LDSRSTMPRSGITRDSCFCGLPTQPGAMALSRSMAFLVSSA
jgi:hypothetical protein